MSVFLSSAMTLGAAGGAAVFAHRLLRGEGKGSIRHDWLANELDFDHLHEDRCTVALKDKSMFRVFRLKGVSYDTMNYGEQDSLAIQRTNLLNQIGTAGTSLRFIAVKRLKDISFDAHWPSPALKEIGKAEQDLYKRAYTLQWYIVLQARTFETLVKHSKTLLSGFKKYQIELVEAGERQEDHCPLSAFLSYLVSGEMAENASRISNAININLPACDLTAHRNGTIETHTPVRHIHKTIGIHEYPDIVSGMMISKVLALPAEVEVAQMCVPLNSAAVILEYTRKRAEQRTNFLASGTMLEELDEVMELLSSRTNTMFQTQLQFTVRARTEAEMDDVLEKIASILNATRIKFSVETAAVAESWFNRLPGNNKLMRKLRIMDYNIAALWPFQYSPEGMYSSPFGKKPLRLFKTPTGQNYAFQFHVKDEDEAAGHYLIFAPTGTGKSTLIMHLLGGIAKFKRVRNYVFDSLEGARFMTEVMGGQYQSFDQLALNPLDGDLSDKAARHRAASMMRIMLGDQYTQDMDGQIKDILDMASVLDVGERTFNNIYRTAFENDSDIRRAFAKWVKDERLGEGAYSHIFNSPRDSIRTFLEQSYLVGIDMTEPLKDPLLGPALVTHISSAIYEAAKVNRDGFSIFVDEAANLLQNAGFRTLVNQMFMEYRKLNGLVGLAFQNPEALVEFEGSAKIINNAPTLFFMAGCGGSDEALAPFNLSDDQIAFIRGETDLEGGRQVLLVKRDLAASYNESTIIDVDLSGLGDALRFYRSGTRPMAELRKIQEVWGPAWPAHV